MNKRTRLVVLLAVIALCKGKKSSAPAAEEKAAETTEEK